MTSIDYRLTEQCWTSILKKFALYVSLISTFMDVLFVGNTFKVEVANPMHMPMLFMMTITFS